MDKSDNSTVYALLGFLSGPIGGAILGYKYAEKKQQLYELNPEAERGWDNKAINVIVGIIGASIAGALFGYNYGKLDQKVEKLSEERSATTQRAHSSLSPQKALAAQISGQKWRNYVAEASPQTEVSR